MRHAVACTRSDTPGFLRYDQITGRRLGPSGPPKKYHAVSPEKGTKGPLVFAIIWIILGSVSWTLQNDVHPSGRNMLRVSLWIKRVSQDEKGQDLVEYALLAALIAVAAGAFLPQIADGISLIFSKMTSTVNNVAQQ